MSFYVTLPSNASMDLFPDNLIGKYSTKLFNPIDLDGEWEVGLAEIMYPVSWHIRKPGTITIADVNNKQVTSKVNFSANDRLEIVAQRLTKYFRERQIKIDFTFTELNSEFSIKFPINTVRYISMDKQLSRVFGFKTSLFTRLESSTGIMSDLDQDLEALGSFYIYTDIITHQCIGDVNAKVLRVVALDYQYGNKSQYVNKIYDVPHYVPLERNNIETINITLKDSTGQNVSFESGKIVVKLHFRKRYF
jgi:hypothetical protein